MKIDREVGGKRFLDKRLSPESVLEHVEYLYGLETQLPLAARRSILALQKIQQFYSNAVAIAGTEAAFAPGAYSVLLPEGYSAELPISVHRKPATVGCAAAAAARFPYGQPTAGVEETQELKTLFLSLKTVRDEPIYFSYSTNGKEKVDVPALIEIMNHTFWAREKGRIPFQDPVFENDFDIVTGRCNPFSILETLMPHPVTYCQILKTDDLQYEKPMYTNFGSNTVGIEIVDTKTFVGMFALSPMAMRQSNQLATVYCMNLCEENLIVPRAVSRAYEFINSLSM